MRAWRILSFDADFLWLGIGHLAMTQHGAISAAMLLVETETPQPIRHRS
jgi:hypothetical protein